MVHAIQISVSYKYKSVYLIIMLIFKNIAPLLIFISRNRNFMSWITENIQLENGGKVVELERLFKNEEQNAAFLRVHVMIFPILFYIAAHREGTTFYKILVDLWKRAAYIYRSEVFLNTTPTYITELDETCLNEFTLTSKTFKEEFASR